MKNIMSFGYGTRMMRLAAYQTILWQELEADARVMARVKFSYAERNLKHEES